MAFLGNLPELELETLEGEDRDVALENLKIQRVTRKSAENRFIKERLGIIIEVLSLPPPLAEMINSCVKSELAELEDECKPLEALSDSFCPMRLYDIIPPGSG